ncbi:MAG TPA: hypothetical protein VMD99_14910 [Terriglobales bacterium]|nr:hypothetical protein [Terriglobales bacterium]
MSSAVVSTSAALSRPFVFDAEADADVRGEVQGDVGSSSTVHKKPAGKPESSPEAALARVLHSAIKNQQSKILPASVTSASHLEVRPAPEMVLIGIPALDALTGGLPRGCLTEICGPDSSGRTSVFLAALAAATRRGEFCALVDGSDALDPQSAMAVDVDLDRLLWVRCGDDSPQKSRAPQKTSQAAFKFGRTGSQQWEHCLEQILRATDLLLESGGFGLIVLDLAGLPPQAARRIPLTTWFRFRRTVECKPTILLAIEQHPIAGSCSSLLLQLGSREHANPYDVASPMDTLTHAHLFTGLNIDAELIRSRDRKPSRSVRFATKTAWAG